MSPATGGPTTATAAIAREVTLSRESWGPSDPSHLRRHWDDWGPLDPTAATATPTTGSQEAWGPLDPQASVGRGDGSGCYSYVGHQSQAQLISLQRNGCLYLSTVQHKVLHALGFHHEQVRSDRDQYVSILTQNILPGQEHNFVKVQTNNLQTSYDFNSVMHYPRTAFSRNGQPTIVAKSNPNLDFGRATQMSANDIARINRLYGCCE
ncbi:high choriolytic enzyme 1-like [Archocentrus centrarchus]|uniref:high choriolytic enzyme 1-like n=1 Tax=Archocentrus centrarchus TaxID=63155 RepID=UPI0011E9D713|nr:high choriolytic enzyme 1-like [Archocentrus centrarchus]